MIDQKKLPGKIVEQSMTFKQILNHIKEFGKTVFLTREEAEAKLAEKGGAE